MAGKIEITSSCPDGTVIRMDSWVSPSDSEKYLQLCRPIAAEFRKHPENLFAAISVNPTDKGHIRIVHGWTRDSAWFLEVCNSTVELMPSRD
jgi:hypothetical protein